MKTIYYLEPLDEFTNDSIVTHLNDTATIKEPSNCMYVVDERTARLFDESRKTEKRLKFNLLADQLDGHGIVPFQFELPRTPSRILAREVPPVVEISSTATLPVDNERAQVAVQRHFGFRVPVKII